MKKTDLDFIVYFWEEKRDIERYSEFENIKDQLQSEYPELIKAWNDYKASIKIMQLVIKSLPVKYED